MLRGTQLNVTGQCASSAKTSVHHKTAHSDTTARNTHRHFFLPFLFSSYLIFFLSYFLPFLFSSFLIIFLPSFSSFSSFLPSYLIFFLSYFLPFLLYSFLPSFSSFLPSFLPFFLSSFLSSFLPFFPSFFLSLSSSRLLVFSSAPLFISSSSLQLYLWSSMSLCFTARDEKRHGPSQTNSSLFSSSCSRRSETCAVASNAGRLAREAFG